VKTAVRAGTADLPWLVPLAVVVLAGSWFTNSTFTNETRHSASLASVQPWFALLMAVAAVGSLAVCLRRPRPGAAATFAVVAVFILAGLDDGPIYLTLAAAAFLASSRLPIGGWLRIVGAGTAVVAAALVFRWVADYESRRTLWQLVAVVAVVAAAAAVGTLLRSRALAVLERAQAAATAEQLRMAQDLHDGVGHGLAVIAMQAGVGLHVLDRDVSAARGALEAIRDTARESLDALRLELSQLAGEATSRRPQRGLADLDVLLARVRAAGPSVEFIAGGSGEELPAAVDAAAYTVVQEALTNVLKHSQARSASVRLERAPGFFAVTVEDDGRGGDVLAEGLGLPGIRDRVEVLGGTLSAGPRPSGGFQVRAEFVL
jgi:signal transduction histidine kinase